ncbi:MAG: non-homologous end-joining DNA ligase [Acidimicrobiia bacterium]
MTAVDVGGRRLVLTNLDKVLYPETGFTKAAVIDYAARIAPVMLPHLAGRALTLVRCPDGVAGERFFEKRCPPHRPDWIRTGGEQDNCLVDEPAGLVWLANLAALELHTLQARVDDPDRPLGVVFDLDPGPPADVRACCRVALELRELLGRLDLEAYVKTSGGKGLHLFVPLHTPVTDDDTKGFALATGRLLAQRDPDSVVVEMAKERRRGRVFVDWSQNDRNKTTVAPYSMRALPRPTVSTPVTWEEVEDATARDDPSALGFETADVLARVEARGDMWAGALELRQHLPRSS